MRAGAHVMAAALMLASCSDPASTEPDYVVYDVSSRLVRQIERRVIMPSGADRLGAYDRYYARGFDSDVIEATYLLRGSSPSSRLPGAMALSGVANAYATDRLPVIFDGMCAVINAEFHLSAMGLGPPPLREPLLPDPQPQRVDCGGI